MENDTEKNNSEKQEMSSRNSTPPEKQNNRSWFWIGVRILVSILLIAGILYFIPFEDRVELQEGTVYYGKVVKYDSEAGTVVFRTDEGLRTFRESNLKTFQDRPYRPGFLSAWSRVNLLVALPFFMLMPIIHLLTAYRWKLLLEAQNINLVMWRAIQYTWIGLFFNNISLGITGGDVAKAYLIGKRVDKKAGGLLSVFVDRAVGLSALLFLALLASFFRWNFLPIRYIGLTLLALGGVGMLFLYIFFHPRFRSNSVIVWIKQRLPFRESIKSVDRAAKIYLESPSVLLKAFGISSFCHIIAILICSAYGLSLGIDQAGLFDYFVYYPVATVISALPISAMGWGIGEVSFVYLFGLAGVAGAAAVSLSVMIRLTMTLWSVPGGFLMTIPTGSDLEVEQAEADTG